MQAHHHNVWLIPFRLGALLLLSLRFRTDKTFAVALLSLQKTFAADASLSRRASWGRPVFTPINRYTWYTFQQITYPIFVNEKTIHFLIIYYYSQFLKNLSLQSKNLMQITSGFKSLFC